MSHAIKCPIMPFHFPLGNVSHYSPRKSEMDN